MAVTSYYQHSQGGRGKYIEKKISSVMKTCSTNIKLSELPIWLVNPELHRKKGIFTQTGLTSEERSKLRNISWNWLGKEDETTDLGNFLPEYRSLILLELKNRVDSGGTSGRREIWISKFRTIFEIISNKTSVYSFENQNYSLPDFLKYFNIETFEIYIGILFNVEGTPATKEGDKQKGFFSTNLEGYRYLKSFISTETILEIEKEDFDNLILDLRLPDNMLKFKVGSLYGNEIPKALFRKDFSISELLILRYDDIWLSQLIAIDERTKLIEYCKNFMTNFIYLLKRDRILRLKYNDLIKSECEESELNEIINYLFDKYSNIFEDKLVPEGKDKEEYLADVIQVLSSSEA